MKTTDWFVTIVMLIGLAGCIAMSPLVQPARPLAAPPPGMREACAGQAEGARLPLPGRHDGPLTGLCLRGPDGQLVLRARNLTAPLT
ncbi:hypothetical protein WKW79_12095 [Variovorax robiniae]|uniref:Uncharacterized protein n=1 Tax=Variovorax robiniae TaxID=1836199 RepID=A0ABU8X675_9BURK